MQETLEEAERALQHRIRVDLEAGASVTEMEAQMDSRNQISF